MATSATITDGEYRTRPAAADLSSYQYHFVKLDASKNVAVCTAITDKVYGVLQNAPSEAGAPALVKVLGESKVCANAAVALSAYVGPATNSKAQTAVATQFVCGQVVDPVSNQDDLAIIELMRTSLAVA